MFVSVCCVPMFRFLSEKATQLKFSKILHTSGQNGRKMGPRPPLELSGGPPGTVVHAEFSRGNESGRHLDVRGPNGGLNFVARIPAQSEEFVLPVQSRHWWAENTPTAPTGKSRSKRVEKER